LKDYRVTYVVGQKEYEEDPSKGRKGGLKRGWKESSQGTGDPSSSEPNTGAGAAAAAVAAGAAAGGGGGVAAGAAGRARHSMSREADALAAVAGTSCHPRGHYTASMHGYTGTL